MRLWRLSGLVALPLELFPHINTLWLVKSLQKCQFLNESGGFPGRLFESLEEENRLCVVVGALTSRPPSLCDILKVS